MSNPPATLQRRGTPGGAKGVSRPRPTHRPSLTFSTMAQNALAVYGTLRRGASNHWVVSRIAGDWFRGTVRGYSFDVTWGPADGYPGLLPHPDAPKVDVDVLVSDDLARHWREIDRFEGPGFDRQPVEVTLDDGTVLKADIYVALTDI
jgi:gamma-glutamylcyclotransferase (GGCT)/AIG2-like uncharacterized protein YtfP